MARSVEPDVATGPVRTCVGCRRPFAKPRLIRLVLSGDRIVVDRPHRAPGRGCYICDRPECRTRALEKNAARLRRALRLGSIRATVDEEAVRSLQAPGAVAAGPRATRTREHSGAADNKFSCGESHHQGVCT